MKNACHAKVEAREHNPSNLADWPLRLRATQVVNAQNLREMIARWFHSQAAQSMEGEIRRNSHWTGKKELGPGDLSLFESAKMAGKVLEQTRHKSIRNLRFFLETHRDAVEGARSSTGAGQALRREKGDRKGGVTLRRILGNPAKAWGSWLWQTSRISVQSI